MIELNIQINSIILSLIYGIYLYKIIQFIKKILYSKNKFIKILSTILFVLINTIAYYFLLKKTNNMIIHPYFIISIILGIIMSNILYVKLIKLIVKHSTI